MNENFLKNFGKMVETLLPQLSSLQNIPVSIIAIRLNNRSKDGQVKAFFHFKNILRTIALTSLHLWIDLYNWVTLKGFVDLTWEPYFQSCIWLDLIWKICWRFMIWLHLTISELKLDKCVMHLHFLLNIFAILK